LAAWYLALHSFVVRACAGSDALPRATAAIPDAIKNAYFMAAILL
jgi:hypothetical protein